ncbi:glycoside hydrolase family 16 protein [Rhodotorula toruloides]|uniref:Glycoside hydrolase family 16 protein n=1 Tax=Rhodotorula toruloides TaxID=5286 RepID=A0A511KHJ7_RHOTO|nr:glycoside hydrolase family 16 protein [Rhodotorula toruloides]
MTDNTSFGGRGYTTYGFEYDPGPDGNIRWAINGSSTWTVHSSAIGPDAAAGIGQRIISEEPMSIVLNLMPSRSRFKNRNGTPLSDAAHLDLRSKLTSRLSCRSKLKFPASHYPTSDYINNHMDLYMNPNISTFT